MCVYTIISLSVYLLVYKVGCSHILANATVNMDVYHFFKLLQFFLINTQKKIGVLLLDDIELLFAVFWGTSILFSIVAAPIHIPTNSVQGLLFSTFLPAFAICRPFDDSQFNRYEVISHCGFDFHFPDN